MRNETNRGLAAALNQGVEEAAAAGAQWVLTLDDDSIVHPHLVQAYAEILARRADAERVGQLGCNFWDLNRQRPGLHPFYWRFSALPSALLITSGSLLRVAAYRAAGPFREDFFIDYIDFEYNLRLQRHGWIPLLASDILMDHSLGNPVEHRFPKRQLCNHHSPLRTYFKVRNRAFTLREYAGETKDLSHRNMRIGALVRHALLHDRKKLQHLRAILLGLRDARRGRLGPAPASLRGGRHA
jgi:rhamnosyltransferase